MNEESLLYQACNKPEVLPGAKLSRDRLAIDHVSAPANKVEGAERRARIGNIKSRRAHYKTGRGRISVPFLGAGGFSCGEARTPSRKSIL